MFKALNVYILLKNYQQLFHVFFKDITNIIKKFATEYDPSSNSMSWFHVGANGLNLLFLYNFFYIFPYLVNAKIW